MGSEARAVLRTAGVQIGSMLPVVWGSSSPLPTASTHLRLFREATQLKTVAAKVRDVLGFERRHVKIEQCAVNLINA